MKKDIHQLTLRIDQETIFNIKLVALNRGESINLYVKNAILDKLEKDLAKIHVYVK